MHTINRKDIFVNFQNFSLNPTLKFEFKLLLIIPQSVLQNIYIACQNNLNLLELSHQPLFFLFGVINEVEIFDFCEFKQLLNWTTTWGEKVFSVDAWTMTLVKPGYAWPWSHNNLTPSFPSSNKDTICYSVPFILTHFFIQFKMRIARPIIRLATLKQRSIA